MRAHILHSSNYSKGELQEIQTISDLKEKTQNSGTFSLFNNSVRNQKISTEVDCYFKGKNGQKIHIPARKNPNGGGLTNKAIDNKCQKLENYKKHLGDASQDE